MKKIGLKSVADFDKLPDSAYIRINAVAEIFGCSKPTIYRMIQRGEFPSPRALSPRTTSWNVGELRIKMKQIQDQVYSPVPAIVRK